MESVENPGACTCESSAGRHTIYSIWYRYRYLGGYQAARYEGVRAIRRDPYFATSHVSTAEYFEHIADELEDAADTVLYAPVTAPLLEAEDFEALIRTFAAARARGSGPGGAGADPVDAGPGGAGAGGHPPEAATYVLKMPGHYWMDGRAVNYDPSRLGAGTQDARNLHKITYSAAILPRETLKRERTVLGPATRAPLMLPLPFERVLEIDDCTDFAVAQFFYQRRHGSGGPASLRGEREKEDAEPPTKTTKSEETKPNDDEEEL